MNGSLRIALVFLCGGQSLRPGRSKYLELIRGKALIQTCVESSLKIPQLEKFLISGDHHDSLLPLFSEKPYSEVQIYKNYAHDLGQFESVKRGVRILLGEGFDWGGFCPGDYPDILASTLGSLVEKIGELTQDSIGKTKSTALFQTLQPTFKGEFGHPVFLRHSLFQPLLNYSGGGGLRGFLKSLSPQRLGLEVPDGGILKDLDTPKDLFSPSVYQTL